MVGAVSFSRKPYAQWRVEENGGAMNQDMATTGPTQRAEGRCGWRRRFESTGAIMQRVVMIVKDGGYFTWFSREIHVHEGKGKELIGLAAPGVRTNAKSLSGVCRAVLAVLRSILGQTGAPRAHLKGGT